MEEKEKVLTRMTLEGTVTGTETVAIMTITGGITHLAAAATETLPLNLSMITTHTAGIGMVDSPTHQDTPPATSCKRALPKYVAIPMTYYALHSAEGLNPMMTHTIVGITIAGRIILVTQRDCYGEPQPAN